MFEGGERLDQTARTQPALFAIEVALFRLAESWGVCPDHLIGHSVGEIAAAHVAGVLSLPDAAHLVAARGRLMQSVTVSGGMAAWQATEEEAAEGIAPWAGRIAVAAINGPAATVVSGDLNAVREASEAWHARGRKVTQLRVSHAFHSPHMDGVLDEMRAVAATLSFAPPAIPVISNVTGTFATAEQLASPDYWAEHVRQPVRFMDGVRTLHDSGDATFIELGPDAPLAAMARDCLTGRDTPGSPQAKALAVARRDRSEPRTFVTAMAQAYLRGVDVDWTGSTAFAGRRGARIDLPTYAFQRERFWPSGSVGVTSAAEAAPASAPPRTTYPRPAEDGPEHDPLALVRSNVATVLGHTSPGAVDPGLTFKELGFDSMAAAELSERLSTATGTALPATLTFDHPTPLAVARHLRRSAVPASAAGPAESPESEPVPLPVARGPVDEPIAIVAMSGRFAGGIGSPEDLWRLVDEGVDAIGDLPGDRGVFDVDGDNGSVVDGPGPPGGRAPGSHIAEGEVPKLPTDPAHIQMCGKGGRGRRM
jgi:acyl transferase domain-containing protein